MSLKCRELEGEAVSIWVFVAAVVRARFELMISRLGGRRSKQPVLLIKTGILSIELHKNL
jgi:hypothetical protein